jgi:hypothetical protein
VTESVSGYLVCTTAAKHLRIHIIRPGETEPSFYVDDMGQALDIIEVDRQQSLGESYMKRCPDCSAEQCPCVAG